MDDIYKKLLEIQKKRESGYFEESIYTASDPLAIEYQKLRKQILNRNKENEKTEQTELTSKFKQNIFKIILRKK